MTACRFARVARTAPEGRWAARRPRCRASGQRGRARRAWAPQRMRDSANLRERPGSRCSTTRIRERSHFQDGASEANQSRRERCELVGEGLQMRSHFSLVANKGRGSVNRSPQGAIRGGFAVSPQNSGRFARCACCGAALARARRERRASSMSAAWDSSPALSPVPRGERSREAFNCVPGDQHSAPLVNSFGVRVGPSLLIIGATAREEQRHAAMFGRREPIARRCDLEWQWGLLIAGSLARGGARTRPTTRVSVAGPPVARPALACLRVRRCRRGSRRCVR